MKRISTKALRGLALAAVVAAIAAPEASALHRDQAVGDPGPQKTGTTLNVPARVVTVETDGGFDWTDAAIGAAGSFALGMMGVGVGLVARRPRRSRLAS
jgi:hypothetical protein